MAANREREQRFERRMSDAEALMWNVEKDPWLNPNGGMVSILDRPLDFELFRLRIAHAVARVARLRERVVPGLGRLAPPTWATDPEFDLDFHVRHVRLPAPGDVRQLYDLATKFHEDPFDRTRPLWVFVAVDGVEGDRGALFWKLHHSITDGIGAVRLSELYMERERDAPPPPEIDLDAVIADALAAETAEERPRRSDPVAATALRSTGHLWRRQAGLVRRALGEMAVWTADPMHGVDVVSSQVGAAVAGYRQMAASGDDRGGAPLFAERSRHRHLESLRIPLDAAKSAGKAMGGSVNDVFVTGAVNGALAYHAARGVDVESLDVSFVVSTRTDRAIGGNSFTPTVVRIPGGTMSPEERFGQVRERMAVRRASVTGSGGLSGLAGMANLLPTSLVTRVARSQAGRIDFATSNLRAAPFPTYVSGAEVVENATMGPVAGTAFNLTTVSYNGSLDMGMLIDPAAVEDPADLRRRMEDSYVELLAAGGVVLDG